MLCSVVIPLYNKAAYIRQAIDSVLQQSWQEFEIIVIDDGSRDDGAAVARAVGDPRVRVIRQDNGGVSRARNRAIAEARGELVTFLDADDWYLPGYLATMVRLAQRFPHDCFYACAFQRVSDGQSATLAATTMDGVVECVPDFYARWRRGAFCFTGSIAVRRAHLQAMQPCFPPGESLGEDLDLWFRLSERFTLQYCPAVLVAYRVEVAGSLTASGKLTALTPNFQRLEARVRSGQLAPARAASARRLVADARVTVARVLLGQGQRARAMGELARTMGGWANRRWWLTWLMGVAASPGLMRRWELWRLRRISKEN